MTGSNFTNGRAENGGALYLFETSFYSSNCIFTNNTALSEGGAYYALILSDFVVENSTFVNNYAPKGDAFHFLNINEFIQLRGNQFVSTFPPQFIQADFSSLVVDACSFSSNIPSDYTESYLREGGALKLYSTVRINVTASTFDGILSSDGAISLGKILISLDVNLIFI